MPCVGDIIACATDMLFLMRRPGSHHCCKLLLQVDRGGSLPMRLPVKSVLAFEGDRNLPPAQLGAAALARELGEQG